MIRLLLVAAVVAGCNQPGPSREQGSGSCDQTAAILAKLEVGPSGTPEQRQPAFTRHQAACTAAKLTAAEADCIAKATDTWAAIACAPRMFPSKALPPPAAAGTAACTPVVARMRAAIVGQMPKDAGSSGLAMVDKMMPIFERACEEDAWPIELRGCIMAAPVGDMAAVQKCQDAMPPALQQKLQERMKRDMPK